ncbi:hypothetical protein Ahy_B03g064261 [Arachis hypogaea]|uniref:Protein FAR1-RELATED SEQUENCE n=1 Tax=Arachis hypogaea TaxID=3818 RepID=A0A444ZZ89_ARAHY|nr:hypothetical protein Ahy_B03g064261 [Arachis hypogaea]
MLFRSMLHKASSLKAIYKKETSSYKIYQVLKFYMPNMIYHVSFHGDHILAVLGFLDIAELPKSLIMQRWTRKAKEGIS